MGLNKSASAAQDPWSTVQFNPPLFWTFFCFCLGGGVIFCGGGIFYFILFFRGGVIFFLGGGIFFLQYGTVQYNTVQYSTVHSTVQYSPTQPPKLVVWRRRRRRRKSPSEDPQFHLRGPWVKILICLICPLCQYIKDCITQLQYSTLHYILQVQYLGHLDWSTDSHVHHPGLHSEGGEHDTCTALILLLVFLVFLLLVLVFLFFWLRKLLGL